MRIHCALGAVASIAVALGIGAAVGCSSDDAASAASDGGPIVDPTGEGGGAGGEGGGPGGDGGGGPGSTTCTRSLQLDTSFGTSGVATDLGQVEVDYEDISFEQTRAFPYPDGNARVCSNEMSS